MTNLAYILISTIIVSLAGLIGIVFFFINEKKVSKLVPFLVAFAAGSLLGGAFLHLIPEAIEKGSISLILGFFVFYFLERILHYHHCHSKHVCERKNVSILVLIADFLHNFIDGLAIGISFSVSTTLGITTSLAILFHELPQELGNFSILIYDGLKKKKALILTFLVQCSAILGGIAGYFIGELEFSAYLLGITAGGFIYLAASDLIPSLHEREHNKKYLIEFSLLLGVLLMVIMHFFE
ncbi:MAG: ZIP family metal transporter [Candidatus Woesearchaeota archaeon]